MKLVVFGPHRRLGVVHDERVIDVSGAFAKYAFEMMDERLPYEVAAATVPDELGKFIEAGERALEGASQAYPGVRSRRRGGRFPSRRRSSPGLRISSPIRWFEECVCQASGGR